MVVVKEMVVLSKLMEAIIKVILKIMLQMDTELTLAKKALSMQVNGKTTFQMALETRAILMVLVI